MKKILVTMTLGLTVGFAPIVSACFGGYDMYGKPCGTNPSFSYGEPSTGSSGFGWPAPSSGSTWGYGDPSDNVKRDRFGEKNDGNKSYDRPRYQGCGKGKGYAGIENLLFYNDKTRMVYGDAKKVMSEMIQTLKEED